ncbi:MAG: hypothetical protein KatS3mg110_3755 [Pirellulaceae bacterium]|nr:MAG: hypothetical protein KatS3mg110_3755 [Pirellulaceae bacterium]
MEQAHQDTPQNEMSWQDAIGWTEFGCWVALILAPLIFWLQGPSVTFDQAVSRSLIVVVAVGGVIACRAMRWWYGSKRRNQATDNPSTQE